MGEHISAATRGCISLDGVDVSGLAGREPARRNQSMKIVVVINSLASGGAERVVSTLTREWAKNHQVLIALFDASGMAYDHGGKVVDLSAPSLRSPVKEIRERSLTLATSCARPWARTSRSDRIVHGER